MAPRNCAQWIFVAAILTLTAAYSVGVRKSRSILAVVDDIQVEKSHSKLLSFLKTYNYKVDIQTAKDGKPQLIKDGEYQYDGVSLLCPTSTGMESILPIRDLMKFLDAGRDVLVVSGTGFSDYTRSAAKMVGVDIAEEGHNVVDHVNNANDGWIYAGGIAPSSNLFGTTYKDARIAFRGPEATVFTDNELVDNVVWGSASSYTAASPETQLREPLRAVGSNLVLGAALSTRSRSRGVYWGCFEALSDKSEETFCASHADALRHLAAWTFGHLGVLKISATRHKRLDDDGQDRGYRVKDRLSYEMDVVQWDGKNSGFVPFVTDDVQLEFTMLNPWVRTRFAATGNGTMRAIVQVPDQIGEYKFVVAHYRAGLTPIAFHEIVPVRPFLHNEYDRFLRQAVPYYVTTFTMNVGVLLLGIVLLYAKDPTLESSHFDGKTVRKDQVVKSVKEGMRRRNRQS